MYFVIFLFAIHVFRIEYIDVRCPQLDSDWKTCETEGGMCFAHTQPNESDTCDQLLDKLNRASGAEQCTIKWRRSFFLSVAIMSIMWLIVGCIQSHNDGGSGFTLPSWGIFYVSVAVSYIILLNTFNYYSYHIFGKAEEWMKKGISMLKQRMKDKTC